jgi:hypothetical protein
MNHGRYQLLTSREAILFKHRGLTPLEAPVNNVGGVHFVGVR